MSRKILASLSFGLATFAATLPAQAIVVHLDDPSQSVVLPQSGSVLVDFAGSIDLTPDFELFSFNYQPPYTAGGLGGGTALVNGSVHSIARAPGVLFTFEVDASDLPGLYGFNFNDNPLIASFSECPIAGGACNTFRFAYSIELLERSTVPEPSSLALLGAALAGVAAVRRKARRAGRVER